MSIYTRHSGAWHEVKPSVEPAFSLPDVTAEGEVLTTTTDSYGWATLAAYTKEESDAKYATEEYVDSAVITGDGPAPGLVHIETRAFSGVSSVILDDVFSSTYTNYLMVIENDTSEGSDLNFQWRASGDPAVNGYRIAWSVTTDIGAVDDTSYVSQGRVDGYINSMGSPANLFSECSIINPFEPTKPSQMVSKILALSASQLNQGSSGTGHTSLASYDGIQLMLSAGTMQGSVSIYGYSKGDN